MLHSTSGLFASRLRIVVSGLLTVLRLWRIWQLSIRFLIFMRLKYVVACVADPLVNYVLHFSEGLLISFINNY